MRKDFTHAKYDELISLIDQVENDKWSDATDAVGDFFGGAALGVLSLFGFDQTSLQSVSWYQQLVFDTCNTTKEAVAAVFEAVSSVDDSYREKAESHYSSAYAPVNQYLLALVETIDPSKGHFNSAYINGRFIRLMGALPRVNPAFTDANADNGIYGGDQGAYMKDWQAYSDIVRKYFPGYSDKEVKELLEQLNSEGCGYVALCNTLFSQYVGREAEFEAIFGFPLYDSAGNFNYGALVVDLYCSQDDPNSGGTTALTRNEIWQGYLSSHGVYVSYEVSIEVTPETFEVVHTGGDVVVGASPVILYDESGRRVFYADGGHAMTVVGVTDDGKFIVSSWGEKYYIDPADYSSDGMVVGYTNDGFPIVKDGDGTRVVYNRGYDEPGHLVFSRIRY